MEHYKNLKTGRSEYIKNYLIENYSTKSKNEIVDDLNVSWNYVQKMACLLKIKRDYNEYHDRKYTLSKILDFDNISCYWLGFLLADGHISKEINLQVGLSIKDETHFLKFLKYYEIDIESYYNDELKSVRWTISDKPTLEKVKNIFKWESNKTKNVPKIPDFFNDEQLFSLVIGFIDGDGHISKNGTLTIKCDNCWKELLEYFYIILVGEKKEFNITSDNCSVIHIDKGRILKTIKEKILILNLPFMERKWNRLKNNIIDNCLFCGKEIIGNSDKIYCDENCLKKYHRMKKETTLRLSKK